MTQQNKRTVKPFNRSTIQHALAFTLAEVLIVIGIIGVVAALTLPNLNHATGDKEKVTRVKKIYSNLTEAFDRAQAIYGPFDTWNTTLGCEDDKSCSERFAKRVTEFMKISKDCGFNEGCFASAPLLNIYSEDGEGLNENDTYLQDLQRNTYMVTLPDGISVGFKSYVDEARITVDIDGPNKGKNCYAKDIFDFTVKTSANMEDYLSDILYQSPNQINPSMWTTKWSGTLTEESPGNYATAWIIENGNLDYLKCYDELNWETKTSCE